MPSKPDLPRKFLHGLFVGIIICCLAGIMYQVYSSTSNSIQQESLRHQKELPSQQLPSATVSSREVPQQILPEYLSLYEQNHDMVGWLMIPDTSVDYPVLQHEEDAYYETHDFYGNENRYGSLFIKSTAHTTQDSNLIIYGHNMKDGSMFGDLDSYLNEEYFQKYSTIHFDTLYETREYEIIAVFLSQVFTTDEKAFKYYQFSDFQSEEDFNIFYENCKQLSLYDTKIDASYGDTFLTLSTCAYHTTDGRLVLVARQTNKT